MDLINLRVQNLVQLQHLSASTIIVEDERLLIRWATDDEVVKYLGLRPAKLAEKSFLDSLGAVGVNFYMGGTTAAYGNPKPSYDKRIRMIHKFSNNRYSDGSNDEDFLTIGPAKPILRLWRPFFVETKPPVGDFPDTKRYKKKVRDLIINPIFEVDDIPDFVGF